MELKEIVQKEKDLDVIRLKLIENLNFKANNDDAAIFSNLWVLLKDWANENKNEVKNRYFSSAAEIVEWGKKIGFQLVKKTFS